jgi:SOS-response transcriptional repressor LexA/DNA-binding Xre family transcriptional regulator
MRVGLSTPERSSVCRYRLMPEQSVIGERIIAMRESLGWSQSRLAREAKMDRAHLSRIEDGTYATPRPSNLEKIARALNCDVEELRGSKPLRRITPYESNSVYRDMIDALELLPNERDRETIARHATWTAERLRGLNAASNNVVPFPVSESRKEMSDGEMQRLTGVLTKAGFEPRKGARGREYEGRFYGLASAGEGIEIFDDIPDEYRQIPQWAWKKGARGVFKVKGWSMLDAGIMDGQIIFVKPTPEPPSGATVVCTVNRHVYIKKLRRDAKGRPVQLLPKAPGYDPIDLKPDDDVQFFGVAVGNAGDL